MTIYLKKALGFSAVFLLPLFLLPFSLQAQEERGEVNLVSFKQLQRRLQQRSDTTYVVNFWATWCAPCREEMPYFDRLQEKYSSNNLKVLLVSLDFRSQLESGVIPFVEKNEVVSEVLLLNEPDQATVIEKIDPSWSGALPATLVVNAATGSSEFYEGSFNFEKLEEFYQRTQ